MRRRPDVILGLLLAVLLPRLEAGWTDPTSGPPLIRHIPTRDFGSDILVWFVTHDRLGRTVLGGSGLFLYDGRSWHGYRAGAANAVREAVFDGNRVWVAASNEVGYFEELSPGDLRFHSLLDQLPPAERAVGQIWGCGKAGDSAFFIGRDKVYRWDGRTFRLWNFPGRQRLFPLRLAGELWFHHPESGLYRVLPDGPQLEFPAAQLPAGGILGLARDEGGLLLASSSGFFRPSAPNQPLFSEAVSRFMSAQNLASYLHLSGGRHAIGTLSGGLMLLDAEGRILRVLDRAHGLPADAILGLHEDAAGQLWCTSTGSVFHFDSTGRATVFARGDGQDFPVSAVVCRGTEVALTGETGVFRLRPETGRAATLEPCDLPARPYHTVAFGPGGLLLGRHGGLDYWREGRLTEIAAYSANFANEIVPSTRDPRQFLVGEGTAVSRVTFANDGSVAYEKLLALPDVPGPGLHEDARGRIWYALPSGGVFAQETAGGRRWPVPDAQTGRALDGNVVLLGTARRLLVVAREQVLVADEERLQLRPLARLPGVRQVLFATLVDHRSLLIGFNRSNRPGASAWEQGLGLLTLADDGAPVWRELDSALCEPVGVIRVAAVTEESGHRVFWLGGTQGLLRLEDGDALGLRDPVAPLVQFDAGASSTPAQPGELAFAFDQHRLAFQLFPGPATLSRTWLVETRLVRGNSEWSAPTPQLRYAFSNLSEGAYRFEARAVNAAGRRSATTVFSFRILPPWYRSPAAYAGYVLALGLGVWGTMRFRERRIRAQNARLEGLVAERTSELVKANAAKDDFLASMSHEIRNPMNGVVGIAESLELPELDPERQRRFGMLRQCANHLSSLLEDILDFSKIRAGVIDLEQRPFDLAELLDGVCAIVGPESERLQIPVEVAVSPAVPARLEGDPRRVRQILLNFISNALKFAGRGRICVTVWCQPAAAAGRTEVIFAVSDDGPGISAAEQARLFQRFERGAAARERRVPGTGLGLALCKGLAERMGGRIWVESEPGRGSSFHVSVPFLVPAEPAAGPDSTRAAAGGRGAAALVVDDQDYNRVVLADLLGQLGYRTLPAGSAAEALDLAQSHDCALVFLDYDLPDASGPEVARRLRALPGGSARARIIATTAFTTADKRAECLAAGMDDFLTKPVSRPRLERVLQQTAGAAPSAPDPLENLRILARKKGGTLAEELAQFLAELETEFGHLEAAVARADPREAGHYAHLLCGRVAFIQQGALESGFRRLQESAARGRWPEAAREVGALREGLAALRVRLAAGPVAPSA